MATYLCEYMNQKHYNLANELVGVRCGNEASVYQTSENVALATDPDSVRVYHFCKVHSYTVGRFTGAYDGGAIKRTEDHIREIVQSEEVQNFVNDLRARRSIDG